MSGLVAALVLVTAAAATETPWYVHYERGISLVQQGRGADARPELERALAIRPEEGLRVATDGLRYVDYLPHLYIAAACHMAGDLACATRELEAAERGGLATRSETGSRLLAAYQALVKGTPAAEEPPATAAPAGGGDRPRYRDFEPKAPVLPREEFERLQKDVLSRCHIEPTVSPEGAPWYFHYELGVELARRGDNPRALDAFIYAATRRPEPKHTARVYGVWFLDYMPYIQISLAHARLGNRECALDALALSRKLGETSEQAREMAELKQLLKLP
jgi:tetratricopeptide (TPR) repeat protein